MNPHAEISQQNEECRVALDGRLDYSNTVNFHSLCNSIFVGSDVKRVVLDCKRLAYIDSSGIGALMVVNDRAAREGRSLELLNCSNEVKKVLKLVNLHRVFKIL